MIVKAQDCGSRSWTSELMDLVSHLWKNDAMCVRCIYLSSLSN